MRGATYGRADDIDATKKTARAVIVESRDRCGQYMEQLGPYVGTRPPIDILGLGPQSFASLSPLPLRPAAVGFGTG